MLASHAASGRAVRFAFAIAATLALGACAKDQNADASGFGAGGAATPGSAQDFVVNVGDRVFFETDSTDLTSTATATLDKQAAWLQRYPRYTFVVEGHELFKKSEVCFRIVRRWQQAAEHDGTHQNQRLTTFPVRTKSS